MTARVTVVGAGVMGLTCAVRLAEAGVGVDVLARELPLETSSASGGGLCLPPGRSVVASSGGVDAWAARTLQVLTELAGTEGSGVSLREGQLVGRGPETLPVADLDVHLPWLVRRLEAAGGTLTRLALAALPARGVIVNCTGVAARALVPDPDVRPVRAQLLRLADPGLSGWWADEAPAHAVRVVPHGRYVAVGGPVTADDWTPTPDRETAELLQRRAAELVPALADAQVLGHRVAIRPARPSVRLETVTEADRTVVHCYGHGDHALALAWGCADDVLDAARAAINYAESRIF